MADILSRVKSFGDWKPWGLKWRSNTFFILSTVAIGIMSDMFVYGVIVPVLPFLLQDRANVPADQVQSEVSASLAVYAGATVVSSPLAGFFADLSRTRQLPFLIGLASLGGGVVLMFTAQSVFLMHLARALQGLSSGVVWSVGLAMCIDTVGPDNLGKTLGTIFSVLSFGELSSPVIGGVVYKHAGVLGVLLVCLAVLAIDFTMRLLVIEKKTAARYGVFDPQGGRVTNQASTAGGEDQEHQEPVNGEVQSSATESTALLDGKKDNDDKYIVPSGQPWIIKKLPIIYTFRSPRLVTGFWLTFMVAFVIGSYDSTIPTHALELWRFDSLQSGLLFMPIAACNTVTGPVGGWLVDRRGTKLPSMIGFTLLIPALTLLRLPVASPLTRNVVLYCIFLGMCGTGISLAGSPSMVEVGNVVHKYHQKNPDLFGENGPYAQLYGLNSMVFSLGLTIGPELGGELKEAIGYGNMNLVVALVAALTGIICFFFLGGPSKALWNKKAAFSD